MNTGDSILSFQDVPPKVSIDPPGQESLGPWPKQSPAFHAKPNWDPHKVHTLQLPDTSLKSFNL